MYHFKDQTIDVDLGTADYQLETSRETLEGEGGRTVEEVNSSYCPSSDLPPVPQR